MSRRFTVEQANRTLPLVRRIVRDIVETHRVWQLRMREFELMAAQMGTAHAPAPAGAADLQRDVQRLARDVQNFVNELNELGVEFKGFDLGLVDFPGEMDGRLVYLCWKLGEDSVLFWHEVEGGFDGRQPLVPALQES